MRPAGTSIAKRAQALAEIRREQGYMAECTRMPDGSILLAENHCPICAAASICQGLCREELSLFRAVLGDKARVERTDHILAGARRCAYRITVGELTERVRYGAIEAERDLEVVARERINVDHPSENLLVKCSARRLAIGLI